MTDEMLVLQAKKLTLPNGIEVSLQKKFVGGIPYDNGALAAQFLEDNNIAFTWAFNAAMKTVDVQPALALFHEFGITAKAKPDIHAQTFKKICRELDDKGLLDEQTQQTLGVVVQLSTAIKVPE